MFVQSLLRIPSFERVRLGPDPVQVVLQAAADPVGDARVEAQPVELARREAVQVLPGLPAVEALVGAAVGPEQQALRAPRIDRERVVVRVDLLEAVLAEGLAAVLRDVERVAEHVDAVGILGVDADLREVERPRIETARSRPALASVLRAEDAAAAAPDLVDVVRARFVGLNDGVEDLRVLGRDREPDARRAGGQSVAELLPGRAAVARLEDAADVLSVRGRGARREGPGRPLTGVEHGVDRARIGGIEGDLAAADPIRVGGRRLQRRPPGLAAVVRDVEPALAPRRPEVAERGDPGRLRVFRMDGDSRDRPRGLQSHVGEGLAAVRREVDAVSPGRAVPVVAFSRADPQRLRVRGRDGDGADRGDGLLLEDPLERAAVVRGLREASGREADVEDVGVLGVERDVGDPSAHHRRPDRPGLEGLEARRLEEGRRRSGRRHLRLFRSGQGQESGRRP